MSDAALAGVLWSLRCPVCQAAMQHRQQQLTCPAGHAFDIARQGYVNLTTGRLTPGTGDTAAMVAAREQFLARGHYQPLARLIADRSADGLVLDLAGGTGYYLAAILGQRPEQYGLCLDLSAPALRRAARAHPRAAALGVDVWQRLPLLTGAVGCVINVFGPRNAEEIERVLAPGGVLIVASPTADHLRELIEPLGLIGIDPDKEQRETAAFARFERRDVTVSKYQMSLDRDDVTALVGMGPSAAHLSADTIAQRTQRLAEQTSVTVAVRVSTYARGGSISSSS